MQERHLLPLVLKPVLRGLVRLGFAEQGVLDRLGIPASQADQPRAPLHVVGAMLEELASKSDTPHLVLDIVKAMPVGALGSVDYMWSAAPTLIDAMLRAQKFVGSATEGLRFELQPEGPIARLVQMPFIEDHPRTLNELGNAIIAARMRHVLSEHIPFTAVRFVDPNPNPDGSTKPYDDFFGVKVEFDAPFTEISFPLELLQQKLLTADPELARMLRERQRPPPTQPPPPMDLLVRSRASILASLEKDEPPTILTLARDLDMSSRSLQRKLGERETTFSDVFDEVRRELATKLLSQENVLLADVAGRLGFQNLNAFHRAFRRWTGESPRSFQKTLLGDGD